MTTEFEQELQEAAGFMERFQKFNSKDRPHRKLTVAERNAQRERAAMIPEERKAEIAQKSAETKLRHAEYRENVRKAADVLEILLQKTLTGGEEADLSALKSLSEVAGANITAMTAILLKQMQKAINTGDTRAAEFVMKASGNMVEKQEVAVKPVNPMANVSTDDIKMMLAKLKEEGGTPPF